MERDSESAYLASLSAKHGPSWSIRGFFLVIGVWEAFSLECYCRKLGIETDLGVVGVVRSVTARSCVTTFRVSPSPYVPFFSPLQFSLGCLLCYFFVISHLQAIRRLARRGGVKRISGLIYEETRGVLKIFLENVSHFYSP